MATNAKIIKRSVLNLFSCLYLCLKTTDIFGRLVRTAQDSRYNDFLGFVTFHKEESPMFSCDQLESCLINKFITFKEVESQLPLLASTYLCYRESHVNYGDYREKTATILEEIYSLLQGIKALAQYGTFYLPIAECLDQEDVAGAREYLKLFGDRELYIDASACETKYKAFLKSSNLHWDQRYVLRHHSNDSDGEGRVCVSNLRNKNFIMKKEVENIIRYAKVRNLCYN